MSDCLFCKIRDGQISADLVYQDDRAIAFRDINPQAPVHVLIVPRDHIPTLNDLTPAHNDLVGHLFQVAAQIAREQGVADSGYRCLFNCNKLAGQTVWHVHLHVLGGRHLGWPPG